MHNLSISIFHTGSLAEYHDPFLRCLLSRYVGFIESTTNGNHVEDDGPFFREKMQQYKQLVTHFFAAKTEIWFDTFLVYIFGLREFDLRFEFAKSRGAIHFHALLYCLGKGYDDLDDVLDEFATMMHNLISNLDFRIREFETERDIPRNASVTI